MNSVQGFARVALRCVFQIECSQKVSLLIIGLLKPTSIEHSGDARYVLPFPLEKPTNNERKLKVLKKPTVKDTLDSRGP